MWLLAGCLTVLLVTGAGVGFAIYSRVQGFLHGTYTCLPTDFPRYPGSANAEQTYELNGAYPGSTCHVVLESNDDVATVTAFYESKLNTGAWQVTSSAGQGGKITFQPAKSATPFGTVQVLVSSTHTEITIDTFTATCLPLNFPKYPGAKFGGMNKETGAISGCHAVFAPRLAWLPSPPSTQAISTLADGGSRQAPATRSPGGSRMGKELTLRARSGSVPTTQARRSTSMLTPDVG